MSTLRSNIFYRWMMGRKAADSNLSERVGCRLEKEHMGEMRSIMKNEHLKQGPVTRMLILKGIEAYFKDKGISKEL